MRKTGLAAGTALYLQLGRVMTDRTFLHSCFTTNALLVILDLCIFIRVMRELCSGRSPLISSVGGASSFLAFTKHGNITDFDPETVPTSARAFGECTRYQVSAVPTVG